MRLKNIRKYYHLITAIGVSLLFIISYSKSVSDNYERNIRHFNEHFVKKEKDLERSLEYQKNDILNRGLNDEWKEFEGAHGINIHIYRNDSLKFWNTNQLPIIRFADIHFPSNGLIHLQNGWYYARTLEAQDYLIVASFLVKHDYSYENKDLSNAFYGELHLPFKADINVAEEQGYAVKDAKGDYLFSIIPDEVQETNYYTSIYLMLLLVLVIAFWLRFLSKVRASMTTALRWFIPVLVLLFRILSIYWGWFTFMDGTVGLDPSYYASNLWFPNLLAFFLNITVIIYLFKEFGAFIAKNTAIRRIAILPIIILSIFGYIFFIFLIRGFIENSSISMEIGKIFSLSLLSALSAAALGVYFYAYFQFILKLLQIALKEGFQAGRLAVLLFILSCIYAFYEFNYGDQILVLAVFPFIYYGIALVLAFKERRSGLLASGMLLLFFFAGVFSVTINHFNIKKEKAEREVYANHLVTEKSIVTEVEYAFLSDKLAEDKFLQRIVSSSSNIGISDFQENLERRFFNGFWEQYEMQFNLFGSDDQPLIDKREETKGRFDELNKILGKSGEQSEVIPSIYYINDYSNQYSYIIKQEIRGKDSTSATLFCTLKSKKIPEEIGFPRLLISSKADVLESLESYSIAKYQANRLITRYGDFNFPFSYKIMLPRENLPSGSFFTFGGYNHYLMKKSDMEVVILSRKNENWVDMLTSFSYLFCYYGLLLFPLLFRLNQNEPSRKTLTLAMKIQLVLFSLVFVALLAFGWGSGVFVRNQYNEFTSDVIKEKLNSVETEVKAKLGGFDNLEIDENGDHMQFILQKFSRVFFTDINLYDTNGYLLATSRPKVFNMGLISEQMNPTAYSNLQYGLKSGFVHEESIGKLNYASAYQPFYNAEGKHLAYINLQHFGQQSEFESQIQKFLVAIINVFILLLAISLIMAILVSNWLTAPLRILQQSFAQVKFGKHNARISYDKEDEIGALVREYNQKIEELEFTAQQLAKSERESAWREMAKQVAHEIKNPLTPMKLSVQQLLRTYDPNDPGSKDKLERVAGSIIEQIDALTKIANEFSNFAKMPAPSEEKVDLVSLLRNVKEVFNQNENCELEFATKLEEAFILADKDQMMRVFNNLVKNAIQAIPGDKKGRVKIMVESEGDYVRISISDNGVGIEYEKQSKIFVPYFTTKSTGTGLGLAMVKQIIENHKGRIDFESEVGKGTTFIIDLPIVK